MLGGQKVAERSPERSPLRETGCVAQYHADADRAHSTQSASDGRVLVLISVRNRLQTLEIIFLEFKQPTSRSGDTVHELQGASGHAVW